MLAALLVCLQWGAGQHALGHVGDEDDPGHVTSCLQCLAQAGLVFIPGQAAVSVPPRPHARPRFPAPAEPPSLTLPAPFGARAPPVSPAHA